MGKRGPGSTSDKIDRHMLHEYLWDRRMRGGLVPFSVTELAEKLGVTIETMSRIMRELRDSGRVRKTGSKYFVNDPEMFSWDHQID